MVQPARKKIAQLDSIHRMPCPKMQMRLSARWLCGLICMASVWFLVMFLYLNDLFADEVKERDQQDPHRMIRAAYSSNNHTDPDKKPPMDLTSLFGFKLARPPNIALPKESQFGNVLKESPLLLDRDGGVAKSLSKTIHRAPRKVKKRHSKPPYIKSKNQGHHLHEETVTYKKMGSVNQQLDKVKEGQDVKLIENNHRRMQGRSRAQPPFKQRGVMVYLGHSESQDLRLDFKNGMDRHSFNVTLSHRLPLNRAIPDYRSTACLKKTHDSARLPTVSIIICFHNEALSTLLRTVWSVLHRSPPDVVEDVILVDDNSTYDYLKGELQNYLSHWPKVRLFHTQQREGLVRARLLGVSHARGDVLVFLDSHCECNADWLQPLLQAIQLHPTKVAVPELDIIDPDTLTYTAAPGHLHGSFDWNLKYIWKVLPWDRQANTSHVPIRTPTMIGGVFAIARQFFQHLGGYDPGFEIWGGENMQMSFKIWQCGGSIEILPCSRVGHMFRRVMPYGFPDGGKATIQRNAVRVAEVWMDEYKAFFYASQNVSRKDFGSLSLGSQHSLRQRLQCRDFHWYLTQVIPELPLPANNTEYYGQIQGTVARLCLHSLDGSSSTVSPVTVKDCLTQHPAQMFQLSVTGELSQHRRCVSVSARNTLIMKSCPMVTQLWTYSQENHQLSTTGAKTTRVCLGLNTEHSKLVLQPCAVEHKHPRHVNQQYLRQQWNFTHHFDPHQLAVHYT